MSRVVVRVSGTSAGNEFFELIEPRTRARPQQPPAVLTVGPATADIQTLRNASGAAADVVTRAGKTLMSALNGQADVAQALTAMLGSTTPYPLYLEFTTGAAGAEQLPWEALHDTSGANVGFLALEDRWPVARRADYGPHQPVVRSPDPGQGSSPPLLRVLAVIAPARNGPNDPKAADEWDALYQGIRSHLAARKRPAVDVEFQLVVADANLRNAALKGTTGVSVVMASDKLAVLAEIRNYQPHVIHVFTHGSNVGGSHVKLASTHDALVAKGAASISIDASEIQAEVRATKGPAWLALLNCCETAVGVGQGFSFVFDLISPDIPLSVGMAERVEAAECHAFTRTLYPELIDLVERELPSPGTPYGVVEWAPLLWRPRRSVGESVSKSFNYGAAKDNKPWTFPVLYAFPDEFRLQRPVAGPAQQSRAQTVAQAQAVLRGAPGMPPQVVDGLWSQYQNVVMATVP